MSWSDLAAAHPLPAAPGAALVFADYVDGASAIRRRVTLALAAGGLEVTLPDGALLTWPWDGLRALPDQADPALLVLAPEPGSLARLMLADAAFARAIRARAPSLTRRPPVPHKGRIATWAAAAVASVALIIFALVPLMADQLARWLPPGGERALGDATFEQIRSALSKEDFLPVELCAAPEGLAALEAMRRRLDAEAGLPYPLKVTVLDHDLVNAFALPGGRVVVFRGLIDEATGPDEVAAVLAHEIGHVAHRDPTRDALRIAGSVGVLGLLFGDFAGGTVVLFLANQLIDAQYSQSAEEAADDFAHEVMTGAELPPGALGTFFERLREEHGDAEGLAAHFSTHPQMTARIEAAARAQEAAERAGLVLTPALDADQWQALREVCGETLGSEVGTPDRTLDEALDSLPDTEDPAAPEPTPAPGPESGLESGPETGEPPFDLAPDAVDPEALDAPLGGKGEGPKGSAAPAPDAPADPSADPSAAPSAGPSAAPAPTTARDRLGGASK